MSRVNLRLEVQDYYGKVIKAFRKEVESDITPTKEMVFTGEGYTLEARNIYFDLDDGTAFVRFVETPNEDEINGWDFLLQEGWEQL
jgi:hypothetical protein